MLEIYKKLIFIIVIPTFLQLGILNRASSQGLSQLEKERYSHLADSLYNKGRQSFISKLDLDSSTYFLKKSLELFQLVRDTKEIVKNLNGLFVFAYSQRKYIESSEWINLTNQICDAKFDTNYHECVANMINRATLLRKKGNIKDAISLLEQAAEKYHKAKVPIQQKSMIQIIYQNLSVDFERLGDLKNSIFYLEKSIQLSLDNYDGSDLLNVNLGKRYALLGDYYSKSKNYTRAFDSFKKGLKYLEKKQLKSDIYRENQLLLFQNISNLLFERNQLDSAITYLSKASNIQFDQTSIREYKSLELQGKVAKTNKDYFKAKEFFRKAIRKINSNKRFLDKEIKSRQYFMIGEIEYEEKNYSFTLQNLQSAIINMTFEYEDTSFTSNPPIQQMISEPLAFKILNLKARTLHRLFDQTQDMRYLDAALDAAQVASQLVEKSRREIVTQGSKQKLAGDALEVYETGIQIALALHQEKGEQQYLEQAFAFAESNKAILLLEAMNETVAKNYGGIPDTLLEQEKDQRINITFYEKEIYQERQKEAPDEEKLKLWENQLFEYKQDYQALVKRLEEEFPEYYEMKYNTNLASLSRLQEEIIQKDEVLVEYFVGAETIYAFVISQESAEVIELEKSEDYEVPIFELRDAILAVDRGVDFYTQFMDNAASLYQLYVAPVVERFPTGAKRILLVTDDALGYLPFEVLLRNHPNLAEDNLSFSPKKLDYFFEDYLINYHYSSTLLEKTNKFAPKKELQSLFAMAPSFASPLAQANRSCSSDELYSLHCSKDEANTIQSIYGGNIALGEQANKVAFLNQAPNYRILHLATHSCADEENPSMSQIYFNDGAISNYELFNLDLNAELAVLSACNTGSGKLVRGEGVMSLSKGFIHAGVPSTVMSLWAVDDCSTSKLMVLFYEFLKQGLAKDEALRQARLAYLEQADALNQHPYYWAPFIQMGNSAPIELPSSTPWWMWVVGLGVLGTGVTWWRRKKMSP